MQRDEVFGSDLIGHLPAHGYDLHASAAVNEIATPAAVAELVEGEGAVFADLEAGGEEDGVLREVV